MKEHWHIGTRGRHGVAPTPEKYATARNAFDARGAAQIKSNLARDGRAWAVKSCADDACMSVDEIAAELAPEPAEPEPAPAEAAAAAPLTITSIRDGGSVILMFLSDGRSVPWDRRQFAALVTDYRGEIIGLEVELSENECGEPVVIPISDPPGREVTR